MVSFSPTQVSAARQRAAASEAPPLGQFFGPAAARSALASVTLLSGVRQNYGSLQQSAQSVQHLGAATELSSRGGTLRFYLAPRAVKPNPSLKRSANGRPPGPGRWYGVHFHQPGPGGLPLAPS
jgi:hypothetical protein